MKISCECVMCQISQTIKVMEMLNIKESIRKTALQEVLDYLSKVSFDKSSPEIMFGTWKIIGKYCKDFNAYKDIKAFYNNALLKMYDENTKIVENSNDKLLTALKFSIAGNLIDFAGKHKFDFEMLEKNLKNITNQNLAVNNSDLLFEKLKSAKNLLIIGDNCGEIVLDKLFIEYLKKEYKNLNIYYGVRGGTVLNDVTIDDAKMVNMNEVATVIESGVALPGTVLKECSSKFNDIFYNSDVIISKGQGNFESLSEEKSKDIFFMFMAKCDFVANYIDKEKLSIMCMYNKTKL